MSQAEMGQYRHDMLQLLHPGETVAQALRRLGGGGGAAKKGARNSKKEVSC